MSDTKVKDMPAETVLSDTDLFYVSTDEGGGIFEDKSASLSVVRAAVSEQIQNVVYVSKSGSDVTGDGTAGKPYLTIKYAYASITDNDSTHRYAIIVGPGVYSEDNPIQMKSYVTLAPIGQLNSVIVTPQNVAANLFVGTNLANIKGFSLSGVTGAAAIYHNTLGIILATDLQIIDCLDGIYCNGVTSEISAQNIIAYTTPVTGSITRLFRCTAGRISAETIIIVTDASVGYIAHGSGSSSTIVMSTITSWSANLTWCGYADDGASLHFLNCHFNGQENGFWIDNGGDPASIEGGNITFEDTQTLDLLIDDPLAEFRANNVSMARDKIDVPSGIESLYMSGFDEFSNKYRFIEDVAIGRDGDGLGHSLEVGEGGRYAYNAKAKSFNGATYANFAPGAIIQFPNLLSGTMLYFGDLDSLKFYGGAYLMSDAKLVLGSGSVVWEYYDGGAADWVEFNIMDTIDDTGDSNANLPFNWDEGIEGAIRFDQNIDTGVTESNASATGWVENTVDGETGTWMRIRIVTAITTSPKFYALGWKGSYTKIRKNGTILRNGEARTKDNLIITIPEIEGTADDTKNIDISTNITGLKIKKSAFSNGDLCQIYFRIIITDEIDTSCGLTWKAKMSSGVAPLGVDQTAKMHFTHTIIKEGDSYVDTNPDTTEDFDIVFAAGDAANKTQTITASTRVDISSLNAGDEVWGMVYREANEAGDDLAGDVNVSNEWFEFRKWQFGSSIDV